MDAARLLRTLAAAQEGAFKTWLEPSPDVIPTIQVKPSEAEMDLLIAEEMVADSAFFAWFTNKAGMPPGNLVSVGRSQATVYGETDLLVVYDAGDGARRALLIEDKIAAVFMENQDGRYRTRLAIGVRAGLWTSGATILIAPQKYLDAAGAKDFDVRISYEDVLTKVTEAPPTPRAAFKAAIIRSAVSKAAKPWTKVIDARLSAFYGDLIAHAKARNPEIPIPAVAQQRAPTSKWIVFGIPGWPKNRVFLEIKPHTGIVDLRITGVEHQAVVAALAGRLQAGMSVVPAASSVAIRLLMVPIDVEAALAPQIGTWDQQLDGVKVLVGFLDANAGSVRELIRPSGIGSRSETVI